jgi:hypothetical protein
VTARVPRSRQTTAACRRSSGLPVDLAQRLLAELDQLRAELDVDRGTCSMSLDPMAGVILTFAGPPGA